MAKVAKQALDVAGSGPTTSTRSSRTTANERIIDSMTRSIGLPERSSSPRTS